MWMRGAGDGATRAVSATTCGRLAEGVEQT
jgi:hypothetical protein